MPLKELKKKIKAVGGIHNLSREDFNAYRKLEMDRIISKMNSGKTLYEQEISDIITPYGVKPVYGRKTHPGRGGFAPEDFLDEHHLFRKKESFLVALEYYNRDGVKGLERFDAVHERMNIEVGSGKDALIATEKPPHSILHAMDQEKASMKGVPPEIQRRLEADPEKMLEYKRSAQPSGGDMGDFKRTIGEFKTIDELENFYIDNLENQGDSARKFRTAANIHDPQILEELSSRPGNIQERIAQREFLSETIGTEHSIRDVQADNNLRSQLPDQPPIVEKKGSGLTRLTRAATGVADDVFKASTSTVLGAVIDPAVHQKFKEGDYIGVGKEAVKGAAIGGLVERTVSGLSRLIPAAAAIGTTKVLAGVGALAAAEQLIAPQGFADGTLDAHKERLEQEQDPFRN